MSRAAAVLGCGWLAGCAARVEVPGPVPAADPTPAWGALLGRAAATGLVDYALLEAERGTLHEQLAWVGSHGPITNRWRESQEDMTLAFLINAYNAGILEAVLQRQPLGSVMDVEHGPYALKRGASFFLGQEMKVDSEWVTFYHLEIHAIVNRYQEPLVHAALNCASRSCPPLAFYKPTKLQVQLKAAMRDWLYGDGLVCDDTGCTANAIFDWYEDDFLDWSDARTLCEWMVPHAADPTEKAWLEAHTEDCPLQFAPYDWGLNRLDPANPPVRVRAPGAVEPEEAPFAEAGLDGDGPAGEAGGPDADAPDANADAP
jgi:hypothetical protein